MSRLVAKPVADHGSTMSQPTTDQVADQYTVKDAAQHLGISENAVMQRIKRGTLNARKHNGRWLVTIFTDAVDREPTGRTDHHRPVADQQYDWSADQEATGSSPTMLALSYQALAPMMERIEAVARENGQLLERVVTMERDMEKLRDVERVRQVLADQLRIATAELVDARAEVELLREIPRAADVEADTAHDQRTAPTVAQDATQPPESTVMTSDESSHVAGWLRRLFGRS